MTSEFCFYSQVINHNFNQGPYHFAAKIMSSYDSQYVSFFSKHVIPQTCGSPSCESFLTRSPVPPFRGHCFNVGAPENSDERVGAENKMRKNRYIFLYIILLDQKYISSIYLFLLSQIEDLYNLYYFDLDIFSDRIILIIKYI